MPDPIQTGAGADVSIGTTAAATDLTGFQADTYTAISKVADIGEFGDQRQTVTFNPLDGGGRVQKARGSADAGDASITYGYAADDAGQIALRAAFRVVSQTQDEFNIRVRLNDSGGTNPTTFYFRAKVLSDRQQSVSTDGVITRVATLAINSEVIELLAS